MLDRYLTCVLRFLTEALVPLLAGGAAFVGVGVLGLLPARRNHLLVSSHVLSLPILCGLELSNILKGPGWWWRGDGGCAGEGDL